MSAGYAHVPAPVVEVPALDPIALVIGEHLRDGIWQAAATSSRSLQVTAGASEIGGPCARQTVYRSLGVPAVNFPDPWRSTVGIGVHAAMADYFRRLDGGSGRYLVEHPITYNGVPGTVDLFDRRRGLVVDWKFPLDKRVDDARRNGPAMKYVVQLNIYAAGLAAQGERVDRIALAFVPVDKSLDDMYVWHAVPNLELVTTAIAALEANVETGRKAGPGAVPATTSRLCGWCSHFRPFATDLDIACPGNTLEKES